MFFYSVCEIKIMKYFVILNDRFGKFRFSIFALALPLIDHLAELSVV